MESMIRVEQDVRIFVNDINPLGKKTILFIHGWPANSNLFEYQYDNLPQMGYRCIGMDIRGFGKSDKPWHGYDYNRLADDVYAVIKALGLKDITLAGHSVGGAIAVRYMARHKGYGVSKLALFAAAAPSLIRRPGFPYGITEADVNQIIRSTYEDRPEMLRRFGQNFFNRRMTQAFYDWFFQMGLQAASWSTIAVAEAWIYEVLFDDLPKIKVPTLIMHGMQDRVCLYPLATAQHEAISGSKLVPFTSSGHGLFYEEKDKFNKELADFIG